MEEDRRAKLPLSQDSLAWLGSQQLPHSPSPGPRATHAKPPLGSRCPDATQMPRHPNTAFMARDPSGWQCSQRARGSRARSWLYLSRAAGSPRRAARWLCPQPLPPPPPATSGSPGSCAPPPSARPRPRTLGPASPRWLFTTASWPVGFSLSCLGQLQPSHCAAYSHYCC